MTAIKKLRAKTGLSQKQFANTFDIPVRTLQQWEQGVSAPPAYVQNMLASQVRHYVNARDEDMRHYILPQTQWKICIDNPFDNCEKIYPPQQRKVRALLDDITEKEGVNAVYVFGSSVTESCHQGSDVDLFVDAARSENLVTSVHDFDFDLWTRTSVDERLRQEIKSKGVKVYGASTHTV